MEHTHSHSVEAGHEDTSGSGQNWLSSRTVIATVICVSVIGFLIYEGHGPHMLGYLPYLLILACPLSHFFMHGSHGGHGGHQHGDDDAEKSTPRSPEAQQKTTNVIQANSVPQDGQQEQVKKHQHKGGCH